MTGLYYVAFGEQFDKMAAHCVAYSRKFTKLPIQVVTNIKNRDKKWGECENVSFTFISDQDNNNRIYKTRAPEFSMFENTLYMDSDSIVQQDSFDDRLCAMFTQETDMLLYLFCTYPTPDNRFQNIYLRAFEKFRCGGELKVFHGALIGFRKSNAAKELFNTWHKFWADFGRTREMPPLACALNKHPNLTISIFPDGFFSPQDYDESVAVQHNPNMAKFWKRIGLEEIVLPITPHTQTDYSFTQL